MGDVKVCGDNPYAFLALIVGQKNVGKSVLVRWICRQYAQDFSYIVVFTPTALNGFYQEFLPASHIHDDYDEAVMLKIMEKQTHFREQYEAKVKRGDKDAKPVRALCIFDDVLGSSTIKLEQRKNNVLNKIWTCNRHWFLSCLVVTQRLTGVPTSLRQNVDYAFLLRTMLPAHEGIYQAFGHMERRKFEQFLQENTANYKIIRYTAAVNDPSKHYSVFSIPESFLKAKFRLQY